MGSCSLERLNHYTVEQTHTSQVAGGTCPPHSLTCTIKLCIYLGRSRSHDESRYVPALLCYCSGQAWTVSPSYVRVSSHLDFYLGINETVDIHC